MSSSPNKHTKPPPLPSDPKPVSIKKKINNKSAPKIAEYSFKDAVDKKTGNINKLISKRHSYNISELCLIYKSPTEDDMGLIGARLRQDFPYLKKIKLTFTYGYFSNDRQTIKFFSNLKYISHKLSSISLDFIYCDHHGDIPFMRHLGNILSENCDNLQYLNISFAHCCWETNEDLKYIYLALKKGAPKLRSLKITMINISGDFNLNFPFLNKAIQNSLYMLKKIDIQVFISSVNQSKEQIKELGRSLCHKNSSIERFILYFDQSTITDDFLLIFSENFYTKSSNLNYLWLAFENSSISDIGIRELSQALSKGFQNLTP